MYDQMLIEKTKNFVNDELGRDGSGHDFFHSLRVWNNAKKIAKEENADIFIVELAALLHDVDDWKIISVQSDIPQKAKNFLINMKLSQENIDLICDIIKNIGFKEMLGGAKLESMEAKIVFDADKLDAIGAIGIARTFAFSGNKNMPIFNPELFPILDIDKKQYMNLNRKENTSVNHFFEKLLKLKENFYTNSAKKEAEKRHLFMINFLIQFFEEHEEKVWIKYLEEFLTKNKIKNF